MGWVHGAGTPVGMLAEMLAGGLNANLGGRDHAPIEVERQVIAWAAEMVGMPDTASGVLVTGTSIANLVGVLVARRAALGPAVRTQGLGDARLTAYTSAGAHGCIPRAMDMAGIGTDALRLVPADAAFRIDLAALAAAVAQDRAAGAQPFLVIGTAGTVDTARSTTWLASPRSAGPRGCGSTWTPRSVRWRCSARACARCWRGSSGRTASPSTSTNGRRCLTTPGACWCGTRRGSSIPSRRTSITCGGRCAAWPEGIRGRAIWGRICRAASGR